MRGEIWLADVVRALEAADTDEQRREVVRMLGFAPSTVLADPVASPSETAPLPPEPFPLPAPGPAPAREDEPPAPSPAPAGDRDEPEDVLAELPLLRALRSAGEGDAPPRRPVEPLARPTGERHPLPHEPLLVPRWTHAIVRALLSRPVPEGPVDIDVLITAMACRRPVTRLPRLPVPTLRYGVQVLVDRGAGMQPFRRDQDELLRRVRAVVGPQLVETGYFSDAPQRGTGPGPRWTRKPYRPPRAGRRVLVLSDLGLGGPPGHRRGTREEWADFAGRVRQAGCGAVVLSPYPVHRWAEWMPRVLPLVCWDRTTRPGHIEMRPA
ncbi:hypothetical protein [Streptomyces griseus]|uniref:hypothetical protein n=1 Tax=Streptomyces griseus TaxID=1911 RepID=UPI0004C9F820|nr:hypothetical protein [Streptomyces griseus]